MKRIVYNETRVVCN